MSKRISFEFTIDTRGSQIPFSFVPEMLERQVAAARQAKVKKGSNADQLNEALSQDIFGKSYGALEFDEMIFVNIKRHEFRRYRRMIKLLVWGCPGKRSCEEFLLRQEAVSCIKVGRVLELTEQPAPCTGLKKIIQRKTTKDYENKTMKRWFFQRIPPSVVVRAIKEIAAYARGQGKAITSLNYFEPKVQALNKQRSAPSSLSIGAQVVFEDRIQSDKWHYRLYQRFLAGKMGRSHWDPFGGTV